MPHTAPHICIRIALILLLLCVLSGCLVPDRYKATLSLSNQAYSFDYIGEMHIMALHAPEYSKHKPERIAQEVIQSFRRVIKERRSAHIETRTVSPQTFQTSYQYISNYDLPEASGLFNFAIDGNVLTVTSRHLTEKDRETLRLNDITSKGTLCIKAFGTLLESNAHKAATIFDRCNTWNLKDLNEPVRLVVRFSKPIPMDGKLK